MCNAAVSLSYPPSISQKYPELKKPDNNNPKEFDKQLQQILQDILSE